MRRGYVTEFEIQRQRVEIDVPPDLGMADNGAELRGEDKPVLVSIVVKWFDSGAIANQVQL